MHDSIFVAEQVLKEIGPKNGLEVTCYRFTADPEQKVKYKVKVDGKDEEREARYLSQYSQQFRERTGEKGKPGEEVTTSHCGRINKETLNNFDLVLFFTTGRDDKAPLTPDEVKDLVAWVKEGGAVAGTHCGADTLYNVPAYGELIGAYFQTHPPGLQKIKVRVEDPKHAAARGFTDGQQYEDEMYIFRTAPYSRDRLHIILSIDPESFKPTNGQRADKDYAISWCQQVGKGRSFYTSFGHRREVWRDPRFQEHLIGGLKWALGQAPGDATPSGRIKTVGQ
jgi:type 1 glutamine amidotransferase